MATESIFHNIVIDTPEAAEAFISALEKAAAAAETYVPPHVEARDIPREEVKKYLGNFKK